MKKILPLIFIILFAIVLYYPKNNKLKDEKYSNGQIAQKVIEIDDSTKKVIVWYKSGQKKRESIYVNGKQDSTVIGYYKNGQKEYIEEWEKGNFINQVFWDSLGNYIGEIEK